MTYTEGSSFTKGIQLMKVSSTVEGRRCEKGSETEVNPVESDI